MKSLALARVLRIAGRLREADDVCTALLQYDKRTVMEARRERALLLALRGDAEAAYDEMRRVPSGVVVNFSTVLDRKVEDATKHGEPATAAAWKAIRSVMQARRARDLGLRPDDWDAD